MPTVSKAQLVEFETPWLSSWDQMYRELGLKRGPILTALRFYAERGIPASEADPLGNLTESEETELRPIASALTIAAAASEVMPTGVLVATLRKVSKSPSLFSSGQLPAAVEWEIACNYQRSAEKPGTNWRDVWGDQPSVEGEVEVPTGPNIAKAALSAIQSIQSSRKRGRPPNAANQILAGRLGNIFRSSGQRIARHRLPEMRQGKLIFIEGGPFHDFLSLVLSPLQRHLRDRQLAPVTVDTIVRLVTEDSPPAG
jgi:hypothetical protein